MKSPCDEIRRQMMEQWPPQQYQEARQIVEHLQACEACQGVQDDYQVIQTLLRPAEAAAPEGGWSAFERRLLRIVRTRRLWNP